VHVSFAVTPLRRARGLLGTTEAPPLLIAPARSVHTVGMRRPIDVVFLDGDLRVVKVVERLRPWRIAGARGAVAVLELPAGTAGVRPGDRYALTPRRSRACRP
jgi:uncharacterized membrane protein (UPF0127 family)